MIVNTVNTSHHATGQVRRALYTPYYACTHCMFQGGKFGMDQNYILDSYYIDCDWLDIEGGQHRPYNVEPGSNYNMTCHRPDRFPMLDLLPSFLGVDTQCEFYSPKPNQLELHILYCPKVPIRYIHKDDFLDMRGYCILDSYRVSRMVRTRTRSRSHP